MYHVGDRNPKANSISTIKVSFPNTLTFQLLMLANLKTRQKDAERKNRREKVKRHDGAPTL